MKKIIYLLFLALPLNLLALDQDTAFRAMKDEMSRNKQKLQMPGFAKPYFFTYTLEDKTGVDILASLGALVNNTPWSEKLIYVNMRAGTPEFDNTAFGNQSPWWRRAGDGYASIRSSFWLASDAEYLDALEFLSKKKAFKQQRNIIDKTPDFSKAPVVNLREPKNEETFDAEYFANVARQMSAAGKDFPKLKKFITTINYFNKQLYYVDTAGSSYYNNPVFVTVQNTLSLQTKDGFDIDWSKKTVYAAVKDVPPLDELVQKARDFAGKISALYDAKKAEGYIGPVWLEGSVAADFLNTYFADKIQNSKSFWLEDGGNDSGYLTGLLGLRVISNLFNVYNDPSAREFNGKTLAGFYRVDDEGVTGKRVQLVERGKLINLLSSRNLPKGQKVSGGHARGDAWHVPRENPANLFFEPRQTTADMKKAFIEECKRLELEYCLKLGSVGEKLSVGYKIYTKDGREEPVYGMDTSNINTRSLRDIIAAGDDSAAYNYMLDYGYRPYSIITPSLIVGEVEIKPTEKKPSKPPMVPKP